MDAHVPASTEPSCIQSRRRVLRLRAGASAMSMRVARGTVGLVSRERRVRGR